MMYALNVRMYLLTMLIGGSYFAGCRGNFLEALQPVVGFAKDTVVVLAPHAKSAVKVVFGLAASAAVYKICAYGREGAGLATVVGFFKITGKYDAVVTSKNEALYKGLLEKKAVAMALASEERQLDSDILLEDAKLRRDYPDDYPPRYTFGSSLTGPNGLFARQQAARAGR